MPHASDDSLDVGKRYNSSNAHVERLGTNAPQAMISDPSSVDELSKEHRAYLLQRHGTLDLDPIPDFGDADPYNWSSTKVSHTARQRADTDQTPRKSLTWYWLRFTP